MASTLNRWLTGLVLTAAVLWLCWQMNSGWQVMVAEFDPEQGAFAGSVACADCHVDRQRSWYNTYHRTMTQEAGPGSVQGRFEEQTLDYYDMRVRPVRESGKYYFDYYDLDSGERLNRINIDRTVGSNRYQQYLTYLPQDGSYVRLHYLWHNRDQRWVHMNAAFLGPDGRHFDEHIGVWNQNCIFCHNTGPQPRMTNYDQMVESAARGESVDVSRDGRYDSVVAELGIACESCHGPGAEHAERARGFWTRMAMRMAPGRDPSIVNPVRLNAEHATHVCAQCHAQRMPLDAGSLRQWMEKGPSFRPGMNLLDHVEPVFRDSRAPVAGQEDLFENRFWADGTPRLTAYEYQGLYQSPCYQEAELSCMDCHSMHGGDPAGQITERNRSNVPCLRCHQEFRQSSALADHSRHRADSTGSLCYNCHMPQINYGVMAIHRSHRIEIPDAQRDATAGRPNACLNCHLDQGTDWADRALAEWPGHASATSTERADGNSGRRSELSTVLAGDPAQKAVIAWRAGQSDGAHLGLERAWMLPYLLAAMNDIYPAVRRFSWHAALAILNDWPDGQMLHIHQQLEQFDFIADHSDREALLRQVLAAWNSLDKSHWPLPPPSSDLQPDFTWPAGLREQLIELGRRQDKQISIGE